MTPPFASLKIGWPVFVLLRRPSERNFPDAVSFANPNQAARRACSPGGQYAV
jgi:hypothetical protein